MTKERAIELLMSHLRQCGTLMPIEWVEKNGSGELMEAFEMAFDALQKQAEYEDMEEQGRLVVLPFAIGTHIFNANEYGVSEYCVSHYTIYDNEVFITAVLPMCPSACRVLSVKDIGETVFLDREEAEQALKGGANQ